MTHPQEMYEPKGLTMVAQGQSLPQISYWELNKNNPNLEIRTAIAYKPMSRISRFIIYVRDLFTKQKK